MFTDNKSNQIFVDGVSRCVVANVPVERGGVMPPPRCVCACVVMVVCVFARVWSWWSVCVCVVVVVVVVVERGR